MAAFFSSRALVPIAALGVALASTTANAQVPVASPPAPSAAPAPAGPAGPAAGYAPPAYGYPPGFAPPGQGYPPGAYAPYATMMGLTPIIEKPRRSTAMMAIGIALVATGSTGIIVGSSLLAVGNQSFCCDFAGPDTTGLKSGGIAAIVSAAVALAVGIPLTIVGARREAPKTETDAFLPEVHGDGIRFRF